MKLATYQDGSRDGQLLVVSRDLASAHYASGIATRLQQVLDDWNFVSPQLEELSQTLNHGKARHAFPFEPAKCMAPLPRAYLWAEVCTCADGANSGSSADENAPASSRAGPLLCRGAGDALLGPRAPIVCAERDLDHGLDFSAGLAAITGDVPLGAAPDAALDGVRLLMLVNSISLRTLMGAEWGAGVGSVQALLATAFSPVAATPDELGAAWRGGRLHLSLEVGSNGKRMGLFDAGADTAFDFGALIAHLCATRALAAGGIVGSGALRAADSSRGFACIADKRAAEALEHGQAKTSFMAPGDTVRIDMKGSDGGSLFGAIEQRVVPLA